MTAPFLKGEAICLHPLCKLDEDLYVRLHASLQTMRHVSTPLDADTARERFAAACRLTVSSDASYWVWTIFVSSHAEDAGIASLMASDTRAEIGMLLLPEWQGRGVGMQAVRHLTAYGFSTLGIDRIESRQRVGNVGWQRLMERSGFKRVEGAIMRAEWLTWRRDCDWSNR